MSDGSIPRPDSGQSRAAAEPPVYYLPRAAAEPPRLDMSTARGSRDDEPHQHPYIFRDQGLPGLSRFTRDQLELVAKGLDMRLRDVQNMSTYELRKEIAEHDKKAYVTGEGRSTIPVCNCNSAASIFAVSKAGPNNGKLFWLCRKERDNPKRCTIFQWDDLAFQSAHSGGGGAPRIGVGGGGGAPRTNRRTRA